MPSASHAVDRAEEKLAERERQWAAEKAAREYIRRGEVRPVVAATYPLSDFHAAQEAFVAKAHTGAMVITVD